MKSFSIKKNFNIPSVVLKEEVIGELLVWFDYLLHSFATIIEGFD